MASCAISLWMCEWRSVGKVLWVVSWPKKKHPSIYHQSTANLMLKQDIWLGRLSSATCSVRQVLEVVLTVVTSPNQSLSQKYLLIVQTLLWSTPYYHIKFCVFAHSRQLKTDADVYRLDETTLLSRIKKTKKNLKISMTQKCLKAFFLMAMEIKQTNTLDFDNIRTKQSQGKMHCPRYLMINWV